MTSQISMRKLLKLELKQTSWMMALSVLAQFLAGPVLFLLSANVSSTPEITYSRFCGYFADSYFLMQIFMMILAICFTIFSYRYLYSKRMVDLYHSVPITRGKLFLVKYVHGFIIWFVPFLIFGLATLFLAYGRLFTHMTLTWAWGLTLSFLKAFLLLVICFFIFYHLYLTASYLSGNVLNMFCNVAIIGFAVFAVYGICYSMASAYWDTFCIDPSVALQDVLFALSPFMAPFALYYFYESSGFTALLSEHYLFLLVSIVLSVVLLFVAKRLCEKRPSELAERGTISKPYLLPARIIVSFVATIALAWFFGVLVSSSLELAWSIFGAILGGVLCFGALNSIFSTTIKAFFKHKGQMIGVTVVGILLLLAFQLDWFGYDTYLPDKDKIAGVAIYHGNLTDGSYSIVLTDPDSFTVSYVNNRSHRIYQDDVFTDKDICYELLDLAVTTTDGDREMPRDENSFTFYAKVELESGRTYYRKYRLFDSDYTLFAPFVETESYKNTYYKLSSGQFGYPTEADVYFEDAGVSFELSTADIKPLFDAYYADFNEHYNLDSLTSYLRDVNLEFHFENAEGYTHYESVEVPSTYSRTLAYLNELYPGYTPAITDPEQILHLTPYFSRYDINMYGGIYGYFGYEGMDEPSGKTSEEDDKYTEGSGDVKVVEVADSYYSTTTGREEYEPIKDSELLEELFPYLYFGSYRDPFDKREYIYLGDVVTTKNDYIRCYVKTGTLPLEFIEYLEELITEEQK